MSKQELETTGDSNTEIVTYVGAVDKFHQVLLSKHYHGVDLDDAIHDVMVSGFNEKQPLESLIPQLISISEQASEVAQQHNDTVYAGRFQSYQAGFQRIDDELGTSIQKSPNTVGARVRGWTSYPASAVYSRRIVRVASALLM